MNNGPPPTRLIFLSSLATTPPGTKVRFLGCVTRYNQATGVLTLQHAYPPPPSPCSTALVDVNLLLEGLTAIDTTIGEWVNVMAYVEDRAPRLKNRAGCRGDLSMESQKTEVATVRVQAMMLWSAGAVRLADYETALASRMQAGGNT